MKVSEENQGDKDSLKLEWWQQLKRTDCQSCKFHKLCGDIFPEKGKCPSNSGGEKWCQYQEGEPIE